MVFHSSPAIWHSTKELQFLSLSPLHQEMLSTDKCLELLLQLAIYGIVCSIVSRVVKSREKILYLSLVIVAVGLSYNVGREVKTNLYQILGLPRQTSPLDIRRAYKNLSKIYHPDKNRDSAAESYFHDLKFAYDVLMDESSRDIYNKFGIHDIKFDPRADEVRLFGKMMFSFIFLGVCGYVMTLSNGVKTVRVWVALLCIAILIAEAFIIFSEFYIPGQWTEFEIVNILYSCFPALLVCLKLIGEYYWVDVNHNTTLALLQLSKGFQSMDVILKEIQMLNSRQLVTLQAKPIDDDNITDDMTSTDINPESQSEHTSNNSNIINNPNNYNHHNNNNSNNDNNININNSVSTNESSSIEETETEKEEAKAIPLQENELDQMQVMASIHKIQQLQDVMKSSDSQIQAIVANLKNSSSNVGSNYYFLVLVVMYGVMFILQT